MTANDGERACDQLPWDAAAAVDGRLEAILGAASGPLNWRTVTAGEARKRWTALREWVDWFRIEFGYDHRVVPPCWYRHPALVNLLSAIRDHWLYAYDPMNSSVAAADWHRALIVLEQRLRDWASRTGCTSGAHRPDMLADYPDDHAAWQQHLDNDIATRPAQEPAKPAAEYHEDEEDPDDRN